MREARNRASFRRVLGRSFTRVGKRLLAPLLGLAAELLAAPAAAEEEPVRVAYSAPQSCPNQIAFLEGFRARTSHGRFADPGELARAFDVSISSAAAGLFTGRIEFVDLDGQRALRAVSGATCTEVMSSLALIMALAVDDRLARSETFENQPSPSLSVPRAAPRETSKRAPTNQLTSTGLRSGSARPTRGRLHWEVGATASRLTWVTPSAAFAYGAFAELGSHDPGWSTRVAVFDARQTESSTVSSAKFATTWLRLEACPVALSLALHFSITPCAAFDGGVLHAAGEQSRVISSASSKSIFWASAVVLLRLGWLLEERLSVGLDGELGAPLVRHEFRFENPDTPLFSVPSVGAGVKLGVGLRFP